MKVELLQPDVGAGISEKPADASQFAKALDALGSMLAGATRAEDAYASGAGSLQNAVYDRAQADVALAVATAAAQRSAQALQTILNMQV